MKSNPKMHRYQCQKLLDHWWESGDNRHHRGGPFVCGIDGCDGEALLVSCPEGCPHQASSAPLPRLLA